MKYYVIDQPDTEARVRVMTAAELEEELGSGYYRFIRDKDLSGLGCDPATWGEGALLVVKGDAILPTVAERVVRYKLD